MRTHIALRVRDLDSAQRFYRRLLGVDVHRVAPGYAQFLTDELNLALTEAPEAAAADGHFGLEVGSPEAVEAALERVRASGLAVRPERDVICCYARETRFWTTDPDGRAWETFYVAERFLPTGASGEASCCTAG